MTSCNPAPLYASPSHECPTLRQSEPDARPVPRVLRFNVISMSGALKLVVVGIIKELGQN
jgi:hypothetical protein